MEHFRPGLPVEQDAAHRFVQVLTQRQPYATTFLAAAAALRLARSTRDVSRMLKVVNL
jgi:hypothetical protein